MLRIHLLDYPHLVQYIQMWFKYLSFFLYFNEKKSRWKAKSHGHLGTTHAHYILHKICMMERVFLFLQRPAINMRELDKLIRKWTFWFFFRFVLWQIECIIYASVFAQKICGRKIFSIEEKGEEVCCDVTCVDSREMMWSICERWSLSIWLDASDWVMSLNKFGQFMVWFVGSAQTIWVKVLSSISLIEKRKRKIDAKRENVSFKFNNPNPYLWQSWVPNANTLSFKVNQNHR